MNKTNVQTNDGAVKKKIFYTVAEFAEILMVSKSCIYSRIESQVFPSKRVGRRVLIPAAFVRAYINDA